MDVFKLIGATKAEIAANKATAWVDGKRVVVAQVTGSEMVLTEAGAAMAVELETPKKTKRKAPAEKKDATAAVATDDSGDPDEQDGEDQMDFGLDNLEPPAGK